MSIIIEIIALSDIHIDINKKRKSENFVHELVDYLSDLHADVLLLTGDIAGNMTDLIEFFQMSGSIKIPSKLYVPGNHDLWVNQKADRLSMVKYNDILPKLTHEYKWHYLPQNPMSIGNVGFTGSIGWYDYSLRNKIWDNVLSLNHYKMKKHPDGKFEWMDRHFCKFGELSDQDLTNHFVDELKHDIDRILAENGIIDTLVIGTHMVPFKDFIQYRGLMKYDFFTAYFGSEKIGELIKEVSVSLEVHSIFGQTHIPNKKRMNPNLIGYCVPIGYPREYGKHKSLKQVFDQRIIKITI